MHTSSKVIHPETLGLLKRLMGDDALAAFFLVGGTTLALQFGHRLSIDLDLFSDQVFEANVVEEHVRSTYGFVTSDKALNSLMGFVGRTKVDFLSHRYSLVESLIVEEGIRFSHPVDIAAMKLNAISGNGTRVKDFYDMYVLLENYSLATMLRAYDLKYPQSSSVMASRSLTYFEDVDFEREPALMIKPIDFAAVRERLRAAVVDPDRVFA